MAIKKIASKHSGSVSKVFLPKEYTGKTVIVLLESEFDEMAKKKLVADGTGSASGIDASIFHDMYDSLKRIEEGINKQDAKKEYDYDAIGEGLTYEDANESRIMEDLMKATTKEQFDMKVKMYRDNTEISEDRLRKLAETAWKLIR